MNPGFFSVRHDSKLRNMSNGFHKFHNCLIANSMNTSALVCFTHIQATPAISTSRIWILSLMSKSFFIPNIFCVCVFACQLCLCWKWLTWSNGYLEVIFHALDVFSIIFATSCQSQKSALTWALYCLFQLCTCITWGAKNLPNKNQKQLKWYTVFRLSSSLFSAIKSMAVLIRNHTIYR